MPPTPSTLRPGESLVLVMNPKDAEGNPVAAINPSWTQAGTPGDPILLEPDEGDQTRALVTAVTAGGTETVTAHADDAFLDEHTADQALAILDANGLVFSVSDPVECTLGWQGETLRVLPAGEATATFVLTVRPVDARGRERPMPEYALSDGPNLSTDHQRVLFGESPAPTSSDEDVVLVTLASIGEDVIHAAAVTDASTASIAGTLAIRIRGLVTIAPITYELPA